MRKCDVATVATEYRENSRADVIVGKILEGYDQQGGPGPNLEIVSLYTDQVPDDDLSRRRLKKPSLWERKRFRWQGRYSKTYWTKSNRQSVLDSGSLMRR